MTSDGSTTRATQLARGVVAAAQLCFTSAECRVWLRSLVVSLSDDIDANVIHKQVRGYYDPFKHAPLVDNGGKQLHMDENNTASPIQAVMRKRQVQSRGFHCDDSGSGSAMLCAYVGSQKHVRAAGSDAFVACVSLACHTNTPYPILVVRQKCFPWAYENLHVQNHGFGKLHLGRAQADCGT